MELPLHWIEVGEDGRPRADREVHGRWLIASQDCELAWADGGSDRATVELRPVYTENPPSDSGIRSNRLLVSTGQYLISQSPRLMIAPRVLAECVGEGHITCALPGRARAIKTWLGYRYDRPAVPGRFVSLHERLSSLASKRSRRPMAVHVRDVLVSYAQSADHVPTYQLVAVLPSSETSEGQSAIKLQAELERWLIEIASAVPADLGVASSVLALPADSVSLAFVESAFAIDAADLSWPRKGGGPTGAVR
jgi:hypothetical protein